VQLFNSSLKGRAIAAQADSLARETSGIQLLLTRFQSGISNRKQGSVIAFTSANPGEGVSHVVRYIAEELAVQSGRPTLVIDAARLRKLRVADFVNMPGRGMKMERHNLWLFPAEPSSNGNGNVNGNGHKPSDLDKTVLNDTEWGFNYLQALRSRFAHTLIDCPSISASCEASVLARDVDGVVLVVEADQTRRDQILRARQTIQMANGKLLGLVLNKRSYPVPGWFYRKL
jgi:Mrp family chromosome partitioning ATPase